MNYMFASSDTWTPQSGATPPTTTVSGVLTTQHDTSVKERISSSPLQWRHNGHDSVSNHQPLDCLLSRLFRRRSKNISKFRVSNYCAGNSLETGEFPAQMASYAENVSIWWRHNAYGIRHPAQQRIEYGQEGSLTGLLTPGTSVFTGRESLCLYHLTLLTHWGRVTHICVSN